MDGVFKCGQNDNANIPIEILKDTDIKFPTLHTKSNYIAKVSQKLKEYNKDILCTVPFCTTVEAEAMGANINLGDEKNCPRVSDYRFNDINELLHISKIDLNKGRIKEVLESIKLLKSEDERVVLNVCGPFTVIALLIDSKHFYKCLRKDRDTVEKIIEIIEENIIDYAVKGFENGADIISFSDPVSAIEIVGPKVYKDIVGNTIKGVLEKLHNALNGCVIHVCGKTSMPLEAYGFCESKELEYESSITYKQAIYELAKVKDESNIIIGHDCIKKDNKKSSKHILHNIKIK